MNAHAQGPSELKHSELIQGEFRMVLSATLAGVICAQRELQHFIGAHELRAKTIYKLELIVEELLMNTAKYGVRAGANHATSVRAAKIGDQIEVMIEDDGAPFDPLKAPEADVYTTPETATPGGLGLSLVKKMSTSLTYERVDPDAPVPAGEFRPVNRLRITIADA
jgi:serine/threonine-protein kinase RsbW